MSMAKKTFRVESAMTRQREALEALARALVTHGAPAPEPFAPFAVPSLAANVWLDPDASADWAIALVHAVFRKPKLPGAVTTATKGVGNAARGVRRAVEQERRERAAGRGPADKIITARLAA